MNDPDEANGDERVQSLPRHSVGSFFLGHRPYFRQSRFGTHQKIGILRVVGIRSACHTTLMCLLCNEEIARPRANGSGIHLGVGSAA